MSELDLAGAITIEPCGCKSKEVRDSQGKKGRSVEPCKMHTFQQIGQHLAEAGRMFMHLAGITEREEREKLK